MLMYGKTQAIFYWTALFCSKLCKCTHVSDCSLSSLEQLKALIPQYTSLTYSIDNGFKLPLCSVNFITDLNHSLYFLIFRYCFPTYTVLAQILFCWIISEKGAVEFILCNIRMTSFWPVRRRMLRPVTNYLGFFEEKTEHPSHWP